MKKFYAFALTMIAAFAIHAQCTIITAYQTTPGIYPTPGNLPCVEVSKPFNQTIQVQCPTTFDTSVNIFFSIPVTVTVDSIELDSVINLPTGITWTKNPYRLAGGQNGCLTFSGTTTSPKGYYQLTWYGTAWVTPQFGGAQTVTGSLNKYGFVDYYLNVINAGDSCVPYSPTAGISEINPELNAAMTVSPNPNNGAFTLKLNAGSRVSGQVEIIDVTGRNVFSQDVDLIGQQNINIDLGNCAKGIYTVLLHTAIGNAVKRISID